MNRLISGNSSYNFRGRIINTPYLDSLETVLILFDGLESSHLISVTWYQMFRTRVLSCSGDATERRCDEHIKSFSVSLSDERLMSARARRRLQLRAILCFHFNETNSGSFVRARVSTSQSHLRRVVAAISAAAAAASSGAPGRTTTVAAATVETSPPRGRRLARN